nr:sigma-70 family RNA polymerase sigma factor [uncultured Sphingomonas sp.]
MPSGTSSGRSEIGVEAEPAQVPGLEETFRTERDRLLRYLGRRIGWDQAPDMMQEVFLRAAGSQQAGQIANPVAFIRRITRNMLIDRARRRETNKVVIFPLDDQRDLSVPPEQGLAIEASDLLRVYHDAVERLPEKTRRVFLLSRDEHLPNRQISERLGITVSTVEYHMTRALAFIASAVEAHR